MTTSKEKCVNNYTPLNDFPLSQQYCKEAQSRSSLATSKQGKFAVLAIAVLTLIIVMFS